MFAVRRLLSSHPTLALSPHVCKVTPAQGSAGEVAKVPIHNDMIWKEVAVCNFDPQRYTCNEV